jgi:hypothetical protein
MTKKLVFFTSNSWISKQEHGVDIMETMKRLESRVNGSHQLVVEMAFMQQKK